jgi:hypothetical protein
VLHEDRAFEDYHLCLIAFDAHQHLLAGTVGWDDYLVIGGPARPGPACGDTIPVLAPVPVLLAFGFLLVGRVLGTSALYPTNFNLVPFDRYGFPLFDCPLI